MVSSELKKLLSNSCSTIYQQRFRVHRVSQETKSLPQIINEGSSLDEFQYISMKIKDLTIEHLDYFQNIIRKVENIKHPIAELMR